MSYTTNLAVRQVAGFVGNTNVSDELVSSKIIEAEGIVNSYLSDPYVVPLARYFRNTLVFTGTGTGSGTLSLTVGGVAVAVPITTGMTPAQSADAFRAAAIQNGEFITDGIGSGATVAFFSVAGNDPLSVSVTANNSPQAGVTATAGSTAEVAVPLVEAAAKNIAAALLLINEYGAESQDTNKDGYKMMALWRELLENIRDKKTKVFDFAGNELPGNTGRSISFFPTAGSETDPVNPTNSRFTMNQKF
jgi:hypothetical protein